MKKITAVECLMSATLVMSLAGLTACQSGNNHHDNPNQVSSTQGKLSISLTDAPVDGADAVYVTVSGIELHSSQHGRLAFAIDPPQKVELLSLSDGGRITLLDEKEVPAGDYQWMRLTVVTENTMDTYLEKDGAIHELMIPSAAQTGLKLVRGFTINAGNSSDFTIDFDLRKSIHRQGTGDYKMRPVLHLVENTTAGILQGTVQDSLLADTSCTGGNFVYVYTGNVLPDDIGGAGANPIASTEVEYDADAGYHYRVHHLSPGDYTVTLTCQGDSDEPDTDDEIVFKGTDSVAITEATVTVKNFEVTP